MKTKIAVLPGDGIGAEVTAAARKILEVVGDKFEREFQLDEYLVGGAAIDAHGIALPETTLEACLQADAVLLGAVGGPKWDDPLADVRPDWIKERIGFIRKFTACSTPSRSFAGFTLKN